MKKENRQMADTQNVVSEIFGSIINNDEETKKIIYDKIKESILNLDYDRLIKDIVSENITFYFENIKGKIRNKIK